MFRSTSLLCQCFGSIAATVISPRGGSMHFFPTSFIENSKLQ